MSKSETSSVEDAIKRILGDHVSTLQAVPPRYIFLELRPENFKYDLKRLIDELGIWHISTISGVDLKDSIELIYHLWCDRYSVGIFIRVKLPRDDPKIESISDILPGAVLYEREVYDLLGVRFLGHPALERLLLPEDWPDGVYPLRKDVSLEEARKFMLGKRAKRNADS